MRGIDVGRVSAWLAANVDGLAPPFTVAQIAGGRSNLTYRVEDAGGRAIVLRRPPLGHVLATAHDVAREHRIISALAPTPVPVPATYGLCSDESVNGAPFYVMEHIDGVVLDSPESVTGIDPSRRRALSLDLIDVLAALHDVDVDAVGLGDLAKRDGYIERQLRRWSRQWADSKTRELPVIDEVERRLRDAIPAQQGTCIAHGDYRFGNCLVDVEGGRVAAVLDWELCTLGDPLADLGYLGVYWSDGPGPAARANDPTPAGGFPRYAELVERYADRTGRDVSGVDYYRAFAAWRVAVIGEGVYARYLNGVMGDDPVDLAAMRRGPEDLAELALEAVTRLA
jgi:aminoglycoside phosphotransferase (APT) family kinase protein